MEFVRRCAGFIYVHYKKVIATISGVLMLAAFGITFNSSVVYIMEPVVAKTLQDSGVEASAVKSLLQSSMRGLKSGKLAQRKEAASGIDQVFQQSSSSDAILNGAPQYAFSNDFTSAALGKSYTLRQIAKFLRQLFGLTNIDVETALRCKSSDCKAEQFQLAVNIVENGVGKPQSQFNIDFSDDGLNGASAQAAFRNAAAQLLADADKLDGAKFYILDGQYEKAETLLTKALSSKEHKRGDVVLLSAELSLVKGDISKSLNLFRGARKDGADQEEVGDGIGRALIFLATRQKNRSELLKAAISTLLDVKNVDAPKWRIPTLVALAYALSDDHEKAAEFSIKALAELGEDDQTIKLFVATILEDSNRCDQAWNTYLESAKSGSAFAQAVVGYDFSNEEGYQKQNLEEAMSWLQTAAEQDDGFALRALGKMYQRGDDQYSLPKEEREPKFAEAKKYFEKGIELGDPEGYSDWVSAVLQDKSQTMDSDEITMMLDKGIEAGSANSEYQQLFLYAFGRLESADEPMNIEAARKNGRVNAIDLGVAKILHELAVRHSAKFLREVGLPIPIREGEKPHVGNDVSLAFRLFQYASEGGSPKAPFFYGLLLSSGINEDAPKGEGYKWILIGEKRKMSKMTDAERIDYDSSPVRRLVLDTLKNASAELTKSEKVSIDNEVNKASPDGLKKRCSITLSFDYGEVQNFGPKRANAAGAARTGI